MCSSDLGVSATLSGRPKNFYSIYKKMINRGISFEEIYDLMALRIIDDAIQAHGGGGVTSDFGLASSYSQVRALRLADGPDEVHRRTVSRLEIKRQMQRGGALR